MTRRIQYSAIFSTIIIADKFGVIWIMNDGYPRALNGAIINGITYGLIVSVNDELFPVIPDKLILSQNYPNPFNPSTEINYSLKKDGIVVIKVFDVLGKEVAFLKNKYKKAGNYSVNFNAANLASGIYFYRITAGSFHQTKKMLLLK